MNKLESKLLKFFGTIFVLLVITLVILAVRSTSQRMIALMPTPTGYEGKFFTLRLVAADLPSGYRGQRMPKSVKVENGIGEEYIFYLQALSSSLSVVHTIIIFEKPGLADMAFAQALTANHQTAFHVNEGLDSADDKLNATKIAWACEQPVTISSSELINTRYCRTVATYENVYVEISGQTFTDKFLTMEKYFDLVKRLDQRAGEVLKISKPE